MAVVLLMYVEDICKFVVFVNENGIFFIFRVVGIFLAGQCVGNGIVVDVFKYMNCILEINVEEGWVCVELGVICDEFNYVLKEYGFFFGFNIFMVNWVMIGGMVGNNSCGIIFIVYGFICDYVQEFEVVLSDGSMVVFYGLDEVGFC